MMEIRKGTMADLEAVAAVEARCFPPEQAATKEQFRDRLRAYPEGFWLLWDGEILVGFLDGMVSGSPELTDVMFADASLHDPKAWWDFSTAWSPVPRSSPMSCLPMPPSMIRRETGR